LNPRLRSLALGTLLLVLPFGGVRVVCFVSPRPEAPASSSRAEAISDCERMCPFHPPADEPTGPALTSASGAEADTGCALSSDSMSVSMFGNTAVLRSAEALPAPAGASPALVAAPWFYSEPALAHLAPPPKHQAL
jgi:hypothetical protein